MNTILNKFLIMILIFIYYIDAYGLNSYPNCKRRENDICMRVEDSIYENIIRNNIKRYTNNLDNYKNCSDVINENENMTLDWKCEKADVLYTSNTYLNMYLNKTESNNIYIKTKWDQTSILTTNISNLEIDFHGNLFMPWTVKERTQHFDNIRELNLNFFAYDVSPLFSKRMTPTEFLTAIIQYLNIDTAYSSDALHELQDLYLDHRYSSDYYTFTYFPFPFYLESIIFNKPITEIDNDQLYSTYQDHDTISFPNVGIQYVNASTYDECLGFSYKFTSPNINENILEIHNLIAMTNEDIDDIFNNQINPSSTDITVKFFYTKGYAKDLSKLLRILRYINNNYEYRVFMCQLDYYDDHDYVGISLNDNNKCEHIDKTKGNTQADNECKDILIDNNNDVITKNYNPSHVSFQIVGDTIINNYLRRSLKKVKAFAINEIGPENMVNMYYEYVPRFKQNQIIDEYKLGGVYEYTGDIDYYQIGKINIDDMTVLMKPSYAFKDSYSYNGFYPTSETNNPGYCYNNPSKSSCVGTYHYSAMNSKKYGIITEGLNSVAHLECNNDIINETRYCDYKDPIIKCEVTGCVECLTNNSNKCKKCDDGYVLDGTTCKLECKVDNCKMCVDGSSNKCKECQNGFKYDENLQKCVVDSDSTCVILNCKICVDGDKNKCKKCDDGYVLENGECKLECKADNCKICIDGSNSKCKECNDGYSLENGECKLTTCRILNCLKCGENNMCEKCKDDYELSIDHKQCNFIGFDDSSQTLLIFMMLYVLMMI